MISPGKHPRFLVYVAAPFSPTAAQRRRVASLNEPDFSPLDAVCENKDAASALGLEVARLGCMPIVPHTAHGGRPELEQVRDYQFWIEATAELLFRCDAALFASNWQESNGAIGEHEKCEAWGIPIFYTIEALAEWLKGSEAIESESEIALCMRFQDRTIDTERPIPFRLPSEAPLCGDLPSPSKYPTTDATFGRLPAVPIAPSLPRIEDYDNDDGGLDQ